MHHHEREQEWQFSADRFDEARSWIARQPADPSQRRFSPCSTLELSDTYYDSSDWRIFRAGFALRLRIARDGAGPERSELTLKSLARGTAPFADRLEFRAPVPGPDIQTALSADNGVAERIRALAGERALEPLFRARTRRERQRLLEAGSDLPLAEVDFDQTSIESGGITRELLRVEVECINAEPAVLAPLVDELREAARLLPTTESKFGAGLEVAGLKPTQPVALPARSVTARQAMALSARAILGRYFAQLLLKEAAVRSGSAEAVHEMRVAARHLDVLIKSLGGYAPSWATRSRAQVRNLVKALGEVRDCDVQLDYLQRVVQRIDPPASAAMIPVRERLIGRHREARSRLLQLLDSAETVEWLDRWRAELSGPDPVSVGVGPITAPAARKLLRLQARKLRSRGDRIDRSSSAEDFHKVRMRAKRLRYTLDAFASLYGSVAKDYIRALSKLQDLLGEYHDLSVRAEHFTRLGASGESLPAATSFALGRIAEGEQRGAKQHRDRFAKAYGRVRRRRWRALADAMRQVEEATHQ